MNDVRPEDIAVDNPRGVSRGVTRMELDGAVLSGKPSQTCRSSDGKVHRVHVTLG